MAYNHMVIIQYGRKIRILMQRSIWERVFEKF